MDSIEEAFAALTYGLTACQAAYTKEQQNAARALALAVLREAAHDGSCSYLVDPTLFVCDGDHCNDKVAAIHARIEKLGKEG